MPSFNLNDKVRMHYDVSTGEFGLQIRMTNKIGANTTKGYLVHISGTTDNAFALTPVDVPDTIGIIYEAGIADGAECWVWIQGKVQVYYTAAVTRSWLARSSIAADGLAAGQAAAEAFPTSPFATDKHFCEIGHIAQSTGAAGVALTVLHFN